MDDCHMVTLKEAREQIGTIHPVSPHELQYFKDGKTTLNFIINQITWLVDVKLLSNKKMRVTDIRRKSIINVV